MDLANCFVQRNWKAQRVVIGLISEDQMEPFLNLSEAHSVAYLLQSSFTSFFIMLPFFDSYSHPQY